MARFDRYLLSQLMVLFGFFALVLVSIYWINQAVRLFDRLVGDGQSAMVFVEFTALTLPNVIRLVLPMSAFAASVYVTNRLSGESELTVMQATGFSPWQLARPVLYFGLIVGVMMMILTHYLVPTSLAQLKQREAEISENITAKLLTEGTFLHPTDGITFYIRDITPQGALDDIFLSDMRNPEQNVTYTAARAYLVNDGAGTKLVMIDGLAQNYSSRTGRMFSTHFNDFSYDISALARGPILGTPSIKHLMTPELTAGVAEASARTGTSEGRVLEELHGRFNQPLLCVVAALIGFAALLVGGFSRFGVWRQIIFALVLLVLVKFIEGLTADPVRANAALWPLVYVPSLFGFSVSGILLWWSGRRRRPWRRARHVSQEIAT